MKLSVCKVDDDIEQPLKYFRVMKLVGKIVLLFLIDVICQFIWVLCR